MDAMISKQALSDKLVEMANNGTLNIQEAERITDEIFCIGYEQAMEIRSFPNKQRANELFRQVEQIDTFSNEIADPWITPTMAAPLGMLRFKKLFEANEIMKRYGSS